MDEIIGFHLNKKDIKKEWKNHLQLWREMEVFLMILEREMSFSLEDVKNDEEMKEIDI